MVTHRAFLETRMHRHSKKGCSYQVERKVFQPGAWGLDMITFRGLCQYRNIWLKESFLPLLRLGEEDRMEFCFWRTFLSSESQDSTQVAEAATESALVQTGPDR